MKSQRARRLTFARWSRRRCRGKLLRLWSRSIASSRRCARQRSRSNSSSPTPPISCARRSPGCRRSLICWPAEPAALPVKNRIQTLQEGIRQLGRAANQLLTLARADPTANIAAQESTSGSRRPGERSRARNSSTARCSRISIWEWRSNRRRSWRIRRLLDDLLSNLVDNALKYTPARGRVTATAGLRNGKPFLSVEDTGPGIPQEERQRVRQRFYRMPNSPGHGSGLGLAIVDEIASLFGASVTLESGSNGRGTMVLVQFP